MPGTAFPTIQTSFVKVSKNIQIDVPETSKLSYPTSLPIASFNALTIANPKPVPISAVARSRSERANLSHIRYNTDSGIPEPWPVIPICTFLPR